MPSPRLLWSRSDLSGQPEPPRARVENPDPGVRLIVRGLNWLEQWFALYEWLYRIPRLRSPLLAYGYVFAWIVALASLLLTSSAWIDSAHWVVVIVVLIPAYRAFDLLRWSAGFLLDKNHSHVLSPERNLVFSVLNLAETMLIGAIWLRAAGGESTVGTALFAGFTLVTQLSLPDADTGWAKLAIAVTELLALVLLLGGVAVLISEVQEKVYSSGKWRARPWETDGE